jgi:predicted peptidase
MIRAMVATATLLALTPSVYAQTIERGTFPIPDLDGMRYEIYLPEGAEDGEPRALVLALHPGGGRTPYYGGDFMRGIVGPALRDWDAIIVAPDAPTRAWTSEVADRAVIGLLAQVRETYAVDPDRILVTGFSLGGRGTWFFATRHPDLFDGAIPIAGSVRDDPLDALGEMPIYVIHSRDDEVVDIASARVAVDTLQAADHPVRFEELAGVGHYSMGAYVQSLADAGAWILAQWDAR